MLNLRLCTSLLILLTSFLSLPYTIQIALAEQAPPKLYFDLGSEDGWVPYRTGDLPNEPGILADLTILLENYSSIDFESVNLPMKRAEIALINGLVDFDFVCPQWFENDELGSQFIASDPLFEIHEYVITLKGQGHLYPSLEAIHGEQIGTINGYFYFDDKQFTRIDFLDENRLVQGLKYGRFKAIILEGETAKHWAKVNNVEIEFATLHTKGNLLLRLNKRNKAVLDEINAAIKRIKDSGELRKILENHSVDSKML